MNVGVGNNFLWIQTHQNFAMQTEHKKEKKKVKSIKKIVANLEHDWSKRYFTEYKDDNINLIAGSDKIETKTVHLKKIVMCIFY